MLAYYSMTQKVNIGKYPSLFFFNYKLYYRITNKAMVLLMEIFPSPIDTRDIKVRCYPCCGCQMQMKFQM